METAKLKKFAQFARRSLLEQVGNKFKLVLAPDSPERRESPQTIAELEKQIAASDKEQVIEKAAYIWFNRFCALRFMDVNRYNRIGVISPVEGQFQPEILAEAKAGHIDEALITGKKREQIFNFLNSSVLSRDPQTEAYRALIVAVCNDYHRLMPYLFERINDYTELLMPDDLLSGNSILAYTRKAMTSEACKSVEVIGWLYQFYISEKKDEVFDGLKKNKKITPKNIPAATQLFTPHWIVRYLVENSLGCLWMLNNPSSKIVERMEYYIKPAEAEIDFLKIGSPEELKICDPACGSGHMLTYAYDLLYAIYQDAGYEDADIPKKILTNNLYGIEIDERASELAAFALSMKAIKGNPFDDTNNRRRFFKNPIELNICRLEKIQFSDDELDRYIEFVGGDLFTQDLRATLKEFEEADNFGSLIRPSLINIGDVLATLQSKDVSGQLFLAETHKGVIKVLQQSDYLNPKYHVVIANPPYMGGKGMNGRLGAWTKGNYPDSKTDLYAMFIERNLDLACINGLVAMITMQSWLFLSTFEGLRRKILRQDTILTMAHLGSRAFDSIGGEVVSTTAFVLEKANHPESQGSYLRLVQGKSEAEKATAIREAIKNPNCGWCYCASSSDLNKIPGSSIAYWLGETATNAFSGKAIGNILTFKQGIATSDNERFLRLWHEASFSKVDFSCSSPEDLKNSNCKWYPYNKGGSFRKWYGNNEIIVNWENDGEEMKDFTSTLPQGTHVRLKSREYYCLPSITYSALSSGDFGCRMSDAGFLFDTKGSCIFGDQKYLTSYSGLLNSKTAKVFLDVLCPTLDYSMVGIKQVPILEKYQFENVDIVNKCVDLSRSDWDSCETSWKFTMLPLLQPDYYQPILKSTYQNLRSHWHEMTLEMQRLEEENNMVFIDDYGLQDDLTPDVPLGEITLTCNPRYRYGGDKSKEGLETLLLADTLREFISYAVGCTFGRYSLEKEGLILANQGDTLEDYLKQVPNPSFEPDDDNVIPLIDFEGDWFEDDISERFKHFLKVTFGEEHYTENLAFIEEAIGKNIKKFFLKDFYTDHIKRYKKRPIYWLFSSPKGSFNALIYMHRYRSDTVSVILNDYLREFRTKLTARKQSFEQVEISASASQKEKTQAIKTIEKINKVLDEVGEYEHDILYPLATQKIEIDLDDGVKYNYPLFGKALKKVTGLSS